MSFTVQPLKVALLVPSFHTVGPVLVALNIASKLSGEKKIQVTLIALRGGDNQRLDTAQGANVRTVQIGMKKIPKPKDIYNLRKTLQEYDIVHAHAFWPTVLCAYLDVHKVVTVHNNPWQDYKYSYGITAGGIMARVFCHIIKRYDKIVAISEHVKSAIHIQSSIVIYNGLEDKQTLSLPETSIKPGHLKLVGISALNRIKNIQEMLNITAEIKKYRPVKLSVYGQGPEESSLRKKAAELGLQDEVVFAGHCSQEQIHQALRDADIFLHCSLSEGFGLAVIEAQLARRPVVVRDVPALRELVRHGTTGYLYSTKEDALKYITEIAQDPKLARRIGSTARESALKKFSSNEMVKRYKQMYMSLGGQI